LTRRGLIWFLCLPALAALLIAPATATADNPVSFSPAGNMAVKRDGPGAALLPDGRVLVAGGYNQNPGSVYLDSTEIYNPSTNSFSPGPTMSIKRYGPVAAPLPDGRVLIAGGYDGNEETANAVTFNPSTGTFSPVGNLLQPLELASSAPLPDGRILIVGGYSDTDSVNTTEIFNPATNTFSFGPTFPESTYGTALAPIADGRVLAAGGYDSTGPGIYLDKGFVFSASSNAFSPVGSLATHNYGAGGAPLPGGRALVAGGYDDVTSPNYLDTAQIFDPTTNSFSSSGITNRLSVPREEVAAVELSDGRVLVIGGWDGNNAVTNTDLLSVPSNTFKAKLNGRKVTFNVSNEGTGEATDTSTKLATTAKKKKKPKLVKTTTKHGGPGKIVVKVKLTKQGAAKLAQKGKLKIKVAYIPDQGLAATKKLTLRG
jgi:hypothetical protein